MIEKLAAYLTAGAWLAAMIGAAAQPSPANSVASSQMPKQFKIRKTQRIELDYLLFLPEGYRTDKNKRWPMILFLHGAGERGTNVWLVAKHGPPKHVTEHPEFPFIVVSPQCPPGQVWSSTELLALLDEIISKYAVDPGRIYLTGLSMGGYGTWNLGLSHPEKFAAIVPICGGGELINVLLSDRTEALKTLGVWAFHGAKDAVVSVNESERMIELLKRHGVHDVQLTVYPEAGHDSWTETYRNPELYDWLLKHDRSPAQDAKHP